jgi:exosortase A-associated hydrolase 2
MIDGLDSALAQAAPAAPAQAFFLPAADGERFCLYHAAAGNEPRGAFVYVHPFAEEMNKCRRMAALQARAFARAGYAVLQIDLHGCGDSSGDFGDARWDTWLDDLQRAHAWLAQQQAAPVGWWGMRLGALLALDAAARQAASTESAASAGPVVLWQPVINGELFMTQFLRMRVASSMMAAAPDASGGAAAPAAPDKASSTQAMRAAMAGGESLEVGGYLVAPALAGAIDGLKLAKLAVPGMQVHWFEVVAEEGRNLPPAAAAAETALRAAGVALQVHRVVGPAFWTTQEIADCPALITATTGLEMQVTA